MNGMADAEIRALHEALEDEYRAWATYAQVLADFGDVGPFGNIRDAEARHIEALQRLFVRYGLQVPENLWLRKVAHYASVSDACAAGVAAEIANAALYEPRHLPAFRRCAARGSAAFADGHRRGRGA